MGIVVTNYFKKKVLTNATNTTTGSPAYGVLHANKLDLFQNNVSLSQDTSLSDLTLCNYTGYTQDSVTYGQIYDNPDGSWSVQGDLHQFQGPTSGTGQPVAGYAVSDGSGNLLYAEMLPGGPTSLATNDDAVLVSPNITVGVSDEEWGSGTIIV